MKENNTIEYGDHSGPRVVRGNVSVIRGIGGRERGVHFCVVLFLSLREKINREGWIYIFVFVIVFLRILHRINPPFYFFLININ